jgi:hypothetical protein
MKKFLTIMFMLVLLSATCFAISFKNVGSRAAGLGGAYTALSEDVPGIYYNPASLRGQKGFDFDIFLGVRADNYITQDTIDKVDDLTDILDATTYTPTQYDQALQIINSIRNDVNGKPLVRIEPDVGVGFRYKI